VPLDVAFDAAYAAADWIGGHSPGSAAHGEITALAELVQRRLAVRLPAPWPPLRPAAVGRPEPDDLPPFAGWPAATAAATGLAEAPAPPLRVIYADTPPARAGRYPILARWAMRLVGAGPVDR
jgi:hypothetical protein